MHRIAVVTMAMSVACAAVVACWMFLAVDEAQPTGTRSAFTVVTADVPTKGEAVAAIMAAAKQSGNNIFKVQPNLQDSMQGRTLYAFIGDLDAFESHGGFTYPQFASRILSTQVRDATSITTEDLRGRYVTGASASELPAITAMLANAGIETRVTTVGWVETLVYAAGQGNLAGPIAVVLIALALAISYSVSRQRKTRALREIHGYRRITDVKAEITSASVAFGGCLVTMLLVGSIVLGVVTGYRQVLGFLRVLVTVLAVLFAIIVTLVVLALVTQPRAKIPAALKGDQPSVQSGALAIGGQIVVIAIVVATTSAAMHRIEAVNKTLKTASHWITSTDLYALRLSTSGTHQDDLRTAPALATVITRMAAAGHVLLVGDKGSTSVDDSTAPSDPEGSNSLIVNSEYLRRQTVHTPDGQRITAPTGKDQFKLLVPQGYPGDRAELLDRYTTYFKDFACISGRPTGSFTCNPAGSIVPTATNQDFFTYNGTAFLPAELQKPMVLRGPVVAVVSADTELISPMEYLSYVSLEDVLFSDPDALNTALRYMGIAGDFQGIDNAADAVDTSVALARRELVMDGVSLTLGSGVLILAAAVLAAVYCDRRKRPMFVQLIHGYTFAHRHRAYLAGLVGLSLIGVAIAGLTAGSLARVFDALVAAVFVAAQLAISLIAIRIYESRFRADFIKRY